MKPKTESEPQRPARKPRLSFFIATACGLGYLPKVPGTWGSLAGLGLFWAFQPAIKQLIVQFHPDAYFAVAQFNPGVILTAGLSLFLAILGVWAAGQAAELVRSKDPQFVVIDEVSGQHLTYFLALAPVNWKYLLLGFILFRVFDIWKPFPARQAESLPGGWGIMADDWVAAVYAALGLWLARAIGL
jgi:phosphatidylglycerophosphatase A